jgi:hypothetical protein
MIAYMIEHPETSRLIGFAPDLLLITTWAIVFIYFLPGLMDPENLIDSRLLFLAAQYMLLAFIMFVIFIV